VDYVHDGYLPGDACANRPARDLLGVAVNASVAMDETQQHEDRRNLLSTSAPSRLAVWIRVSVMSDAEEMVPTGPAS